MNVSPYLRKFICDTNNTAFQFVVNDIMCSYVIISKQYNHELLLNSCVIE